MFTVFRYIFLAIHCTCPTSAWKGGWHVYCLVAVKTRHLAGVGVIDNCVCMYTHWLAVATNFSSPIVLMLCVCTPEVAGVISNRAVTLQYLFICIFFSFEQYEGAYWSEHEGVFELHVLHVLVQSC